MVGRILSSQPLPDLRSFVPDGRWEAIAWVGDVPEVAQEAKPRRRRPRKPDLSSFIHDGRTEAIAWAWDEPTDWSSQELPPRTAGHKRPGRDRPGSAAKLNPAPGEDGAPPTAQAEADTLAANEAVEDLAEGLAPGSTGSFERLDACIPVPWLTPSDDLFDPPEPAVASKDDRECRRAVDRIDANESACPPPPIIADPCDRCSNIISFDPSPSLILETASNLFAPPTVVTQDEVDLINAAWNFLQQNSDIVEWVGCLLRGPNNGKCLVDRLFDTQDPQIITFDSEPPVGYRRFAMWTGYLSEHIHVNMDSSWWSGGVRRDEDGEILVDEEGEPIVREGVVEAFDHATSFTLGNTANLVCVVADVASLILHEMLHGCLSPLNDASDDDDGCDTSYMIQNAFMSAIGKRFPCILESDRCDPFAEDDMWMADT